MIAEEAELLIALLRKLGNRTVTHLITYSAPVTRKMLHFNKLNYYAIPALPRSWTAPTWLTIELGIFAGRLYFEFDEYDGLREYLGLKRLSGNDGEQIAGSTDPLSPIEAHATDASAHFTDPASPTDENNNMSTTFTEKPLQFLQDWLAARRRGQDFSHTPMGHVCQDKPLDATHAFFAKTEKQDDVGHVITAFSAQEAAEDGEGALEDDWADDMIYGEEGEVDGEDEVGWGDLESEQEEEEEEGEVDEEEKGEDDKEDAEEEEEQSEESYDTSSGDSESS